MRLCKFTPCNSTPKPFEFHTKSPRRGVGLHLHRVSVRPWGAPFFLLFFVPRRRHRHLESGVDGVLTFSASILLKGIDNKQEVHIASYGTSERLLVPDRAFDHIFAYVFIVAKSIQVAPGYYSAPRITNTL